MDFFRYLFIVIALTLTSLAGPGLAQESTDNLVTLITDLKFNPGDDALREQVIEMALQQPAQELPAAAERKFFRGGAIMNLAESKNDFERAALEFEAAANLAPWSSKFYYEAGIAFGKAGNFSQAKKNFGFYLLATPDAPDFFEVEGMYNEYGFLAERAAKEAKAKKLRDDEKKLAAEKQFFAEAIKPFEGAWNIQYCSSTKPGKGCTEKQRHKSRWVQMKGKYSFQFPGDGTVIIELPRCGIVRGTPQSTDPTSTIWELVSEDGSKKRIWSYTFRTGFGFGISCNRPVSDENFNKKIKYNYFNIWR